MTRVHVGKALRYSGVAVLWIVTLILVFAVWSLLRYVLLVLWG